jgi:hypothetical protein
MRIYSDPARESDSTALSDVEVFYREESENTQETVFYDEHDDEPYGTGWYYWYCFPGCMPDSSPFGPFKTEAEAVADCRESVAW